MKFVLIRAFFALLSFLFSVGWGTPAYAHGTPPGCESLLAPFKPLTLRTLREAARERIARNELLAPRPGFDNLEIEAQTEQVGESGPQALQQMLGIGRYFVATPAPTSPDIASVSLLEEEKSFPIHVDLAWAGRRTSTSVYVSLPRPLSTSGYLIGPEYPVVLVHLHGGGTPTATGKNGVSIGEKMVQLGIPVLAPDMPGHGRATRNPGGLMSFREQSEWLMQLLDQVVHPRVKIVLSGHSWGGMFSIYMHRHSDDPRFKRIVRYISLSPGVDTSMGGSPAERVRADQWYERNYPNFKDRIAAADFEFQENLLLNGKDSDIGAFFTGFTNIDYSTPPLKPEIQANLKPITVVVGTADGVVYVGREREFDTIFASLLEPSSYVKLGPGRTWKSKDESDLLPTGHNIFDRYIDGTTTLEVYNLIASLVRSEGEAPVGGVDDRAVSLVDAVFRHYANFFAFREMVAHQVESITVPTPELAEISARKVQLDDYYRKIEERRATLKREQDERVAKALAALRSELGIADPISLERAEQELSMPDLTEARRLELEKFLTDVRRLDEEMKVDFSDPLAEAEDAALSRDFAHALRKIGAGVLADYKPALDALMGKRALSRDEEKLRSELGRLHQRYAAAQKARQNRFGLERDRRLAALDLPRGVTDQRTAMRELKADRSPERRLALTEYVRRASAVVSAARAEALKDLNERLESMAKPEGVTSIDMGQDLKVEADQRLTFTYAPEGLPEVREIAARIRELEEAQIRSTQGHDGELSLDRLEASVRELRSKRGALLKRWEALWAKGILASPEMDRLSAGYERTLASFKELYQSYEATKGRWLADLKEEGRWQADVVLAQTPELLALRRKVQHAKKMFLSAREALAELRVTEALHNQLSGPEGAVLEAGRMAADLRAAESVLKSQEDYLEARRQRQSLIHRELDELRHRYVERMRAALEPVPYLIERVVIWDLLNQPAADLVERLRGDKVAFEALSRTLSRWESFLAELRR